MIDQIYSPKHLAEKLVKHASWTRAVIIADFAAGDGKLLEVAATRWPEARVAGTDVNARVVREMKRMHENWDVGRCDFLDANSRSRCAVLRGLPGKVSVALLNPPFSCRGAKRWKATVGGTTVKCSLALAFVLTALQYLDDGGELLAVLPAGSAGSEKDSQAWSVLRESWRIDFLGENGHRTFAGCFPRTSIVRITRGTATPIKKLASLRPRAIRGLQDGSVRVIRGTLPMYLAPFIKNGPVLPLVHTTDLKNGKINLRRVQRIGAHRCITGPAVLLGRVGMPQKEAICLYGRRKQIGLSDCIISLRCSTLDDAHRLQRSLIRRFDSLESRYGGTCAPYLTVKRVTELLRQWGIMVDAVAPVRPSTPSHVKCGIDSARSNHRPVCPNPPLPRTDAGKSETSTKIVRGTGSTNSCAMRSPRSTKKG